MSLPVGDELIVLVSRTSAGAWIECVCCGIGLPGGGVRGQQRAVSTAAATPPPISVRCDDRESKLSGQQSHRARSNQQPRPGCRRRGADFVSDRLSRPC